MSTETPRPNQAGSLALVIADIATALWAQKKLIVTATLVCALAAAAVALVLPKTYESGITLLLLPPGFKEWASDTKFESKDLVGMFPKLLTPADYAVLFKRASLLLKVVDDLRAKGVHSERDLEDLGKPSVLDEQLTVETRIAEKTAYRTEYSPVIRLVARARTPELARDLAQAWAEIAVEESAKYYQSEGGKMSAFFTEQYGRTKGELEEVFSQQKAVENEWDEPSARTRILDKTVFLTQLEEERAHVTVDIESARKEVEELTAAMGKEKPTLTLWKSPPTTALFLKDALKTPPASPDQKTEETKGPGYYEETINETYLYLQQEIANRQAALRGLEERERSLETSIENSSKELEALRQDTARYAAESKTLHQREEGLSRGYQLIADGLRQATIAESEQQSLADLKLVTTAVLPDKKVAPARTAIVLSAAFSGLVISCCTALVRYRLKTAP